MKAFFTLCLLTGVLPVFSQTKTWPVLKHYEKEQTYRIAMPVGGIGTGDISIGGNGQWRDVEMMNKPGIGFYGSVTPQQAPCFMVFVQDKAGKKYAKALMGPIPPDQYAGSEGSQAPNHGMPRFKSATFDAAYPFATVNLEDDEIPVSVKTKVFNPFIPCDADASGIPVAIIRYVVTNKTNQEMQVAVAGSMDNFIGMDGFKLDFNSFNRALTPVGAKNNRNTFRQSAHLAGIYMTSDSVDHDVSTWGNIALTTSELNKGYKISYCIQFNPKGWNSNMTDMWDDFSDDGQFENKTFDHKVNDPRAALSVKLTLGPNETKEVQFMLTWDFPNRKDWDDKQTIGNYYSTKYTDAWDVAEKTLDQLPILESKTLDFVNAFINSSYPAEVKEAALFNTTGSCYGNCAHVWNYEYASPFLFGSLAKSMRQTDYNYALSDNGLMSFRVSLPLKKDGNWKVAAADGQMGAVMKAYREWQLSGDDDFLKAAWPGIKKALSFAWIPGGWDADKDGVMEGCQHNTMDIEYYGPNPEIEFWYLGALKAGAAMAHQQKDAAFEATCKSLFEKGSHWTDQNLFNGEYYIQKIKPVKNAGEVAPGLSAGMGSKDISDPDFQIGEGCLVDQLVGQNMAFVCGLGYLTKPENIRSALKSIVKYNSAKSFTNTFNNMRSYALDNEAGLMLTAYPDPSKRPAIPLSYHAETWTGLEYTAATGLFYEGINDEGIDIIKNIRNRYDGYKRNPFNEEECGNHYARAMASWSAILALSGFHYSASDGSFSITSKPGNYFWSNGYAWGSVKVDADAVTLKVMHGDLKLAHLKVGDKNDLKIKDAAVLKEGDEKSFKM